VVPPVDALEERGVAAAVEDGDGGPTGGFEWGDGRALEAAAAEGEGAGGEVHFLEEVRLLLQLVVQGQVGLLLGAKDALPRGLDSVTIFRPNCAILGTPKRPGCGCAWSAGPAPLA
jgi:hypothetical protein